MGTLQLRLGSWMPDIDTIVERFDAVTISTIDDLCPR